MIVSKYQRRVGGFDEAVISLSARGLTTGEFQSHLEEIYGAEVSKDTISRIADSINAEAAEWQSRPLDSVWPVIVIDAIVVKIRDGMVATVNGGRAGRARAVVGHRGRRVQAVARHFDRTEEPRARRRVDLLL